MKIIYTKHAEEMCVLRKIDKKLISQCIHNPDEVLPAREEKKIIFKDCGKNYLKVIVAEEKEATMVVTVYWFAKARMKL